MLGEITHDVGVFERSRLSGDACCMANQTMRAVRADEDLSLPVDLDLGVIRIGDCGTSGGVNGQTGLPFVVRYFGEIRDFPAGL